MQQPCRRRLTGWATTADIDWFCTNFNCPIAMNYMLTAEVITLQYSRLYEYQIAMVDYIAWTLVVLNTNRQET